MYLFGIFIFVLLIIWLLSIAIKGSLCLLADKEEKYSKSDMTTSGLKSLMAFSTTFIECFLPFLRFFILEITVFTLETLLRRYISLKALTLSISFTFFDKKS